MLIPVQSRGEYHLTKSASSHPGFAALKAHISIDHVKGQTSHNHLVKHNITISKKVFEAQTNK